MKVAIVGSRNIDNLELLEFVWNKIGFDYSFTIISGGAKGVDTNARQLAEKYQMDIIEYLPDWNKYGKSAGFRRNKTIIKECDVCIAIWDGKSHGTKHDIDLCKEYDKNCFVYNNKDKSLKAYVNEYSKTQKIISIIPKELDL